MGIINFYRTHLAHAAETQAPLIAYLGGASKRDKREIVRSSEAEEAFTQTKNDLARAAIKAHPICGARLRIVSGASNFAVGATLEQQCNGFWELLTFFSCRFSLVQANYSAHDRELTAMYQAVKRFRHFIEGRVFDIVTDQEPLSHAFSQLSDGSTMTAIRIRELSFIGQYDQHQIHSR